MKLSASARSAGVVVLVIKDPLDSVCGVGGALRERATACRKLA
jgi:hypothetical protein